MVQRSGSSNAPDVLLGRYQLVKLLGRGGMAEVYQGHDVLLDRRVAVKLLTGAHNENPNWSRRLQREARAGALVNHPNVIAVHDIGIVSSTIFVVMEHVDGETLNQLLRREGALPAPTASRIAAGVCAALEAAHSQRVIHRDITPANIMVCRDGTPKVMDFGIARLAETDVVTAQGQVLGTPAYLSPEQASAQQPDTRSDLYSLGCCLYHMLTGQVPFPGAAPAAAAYSHIQQQPPPPRAINPTVPEDMQTVILRAMTKDPRQRYQTATQMKQDLARCQTSPATTAPTPGEDTIAIPGTTSPDPPTAIAAAAEPNEHTDDRGLLHRRLGAALIVLACAVIAAVLVYLLYSGATSL